MNILDVAENSVRAGAHRIEIQVTADTEKDCLTISIGDDGCGMNQEQVKKVLDPFYTTRTTRKVGLGVPFFKQAAESTNGSFDIASEEGRGTIVTATFQLSHIDRMPMGDLSASIHTLVVFHEDLEIYFRYTVDSRFFELDTKEIREIVGDVSFQNLEVSGFIREYLENNMTEVNSDNII